MKISENYLSHIFQVEAFHSTKLAYPTIQHLVYKINNAHFGWEVGQY